MHGRTLDQVHLHVQGCAQGFCNAGISMGNQNGKRQQRLHVQAKEDSVSICMQSKKQKVGINVKTQTPAMYRHSCACGVTTDPGCCTAAGCRHQTRPASLRGCRPCHWS